VNFKINCTKSTPTYSLIGIRVEWNRACVGDCEVGNGWYELLSSVCWRIYQHEKNIEDHKKYLAKNNKDIQQDFGIKVRW